jgi:hypothetical protein
MTAIDANNRLTLAVKAKNRPCMSARTARCSAKNEPACSGALITPITTPPFG